MRQRVAIGSELAPVPVPSKRVRLNVRLPEESGVVRLYAHEKGPRGKPTRSDFAVWDPLGKWWNVRGRVWWTVELKGRWKYWSR